MPIHDWTRVPSGLFHHFRQDWSIEIARTLNRSARLPKGVSAIFEQKSDPKESDVLAVESRSKPTKFDSNGTATAVLAKPKLVTRFIRRTTVETYSARANRIILKHHLGRTVAVIEIVSPGNKDSKRAPRVRG